MARFSGFERLLVIGGIVGVSFFGGRVYENVKGSDWNNYSRAEDAIYVNKQMNEHRRWKFYNSAFGVSFLVFPIFYAQGRKELRDIEEEGE